MTQKFISPEEVTELILSLPSKPLEKRVSYRGFLIMVPMPCWNEEGKVGGLF